MAVTKHFDTVVAVKTSAFGIGDAFIGLQRRLLGTGSQFDRFVRRHFRRVEKIEIRGIECQQLFVGNAGVGSGEV